MLRASLFCVAVHLINCYYKGDFMSNLFLASWADVSEIEDKNYLDYDSLVTSDEEWLILSSLIDEGEDYDY